VVACWLEYIVEEALKLPPEATGAVEELCSGATVEAPVLPDAAGEALELPPDEPEADPSPIPFTGKQVPVKEPASSAAETV
jgi:hypothetical protein